MTSEPIDMLSTGGGLTQRQQAWVALSVLFVDTELTDDTLRSVARKLIALHLDAVSAEVILFEDVAPVFVKNMLSVAGNWTGWEAQDVIQLVSEWIAKRDAQGFQGALLRSPLADHLRRRLSLHFIGREWQAVVDAMTSHV